MPPKLKKKVATRGGIGADQPVLRAAQIVKRAVDDTVTRCNSGDVRKLLARRVLSKLVEALQLSPSTIFPPGLEPIVLVGGSDAMKYIVNDFNTTMETLTTMETEYLAKDKMATTWVQSLQTAMESYEDSLDCVGKSMKVTIIIPQNNQNYFKSAFERVVSTVSDVLSSVKEEILSSPDSNRRAIWQQFKACLNGTDPLLTAPRHSDRKAANKSNPELASAVSDMHITIHDVDQIISTPPTTSETKRVSAHVYTLRVGYSIADTGMVGSSDLLTISIPRQDDTESTEILRDIDSNTMQLNYEHLQTSSRVFTYNLRSCAKYIASALDTLTTLTPATTTTGAQDMCRASLKMLQALCHMQMLRCLMDFFRERPNYNAAVGLVVSNAHPDQDAPHLEKFVKDRFDAIEHKIKSDWTSDRSVSKLVYNKAVEILQEYKVLTLTSMMVLMQLFARSKVAQENCDQLLRRYDSPNATTSVDMMGGTYNQKKGNNGNKGRNGNKGKKGQNNKKNNNTGENGNNKDGKKGKGKINKVDEDVLLAMKGDCKKRTDNNPQARIRDIQVMADWYTALTRSVADPLKKLMDVSVEQNKTVINCLPLSVQEKLRDIKNFIDDLETYYKPRLQDVYSDAHQALMEDSVSSQSMFSDMNGRIVDTEDEGSIMALFEAKQLFFTFGTSPSSVRSVNIWTTLIDNPVNFNKMFEEAKKGMSGYEPSSSFRHVYFHKKRQEFWFLWTAKAPDVKNRIVTIVTATLSLDVKDKTPKINIDNISYDTALSLNKTSRTIRLSAMDTAHIERKRAGLLY